MRSVLAIAKREILSFFVSPVAYFVITGFVLLGGYFFFNYLYIFNVISSRYQAMPYGAPEAPNLNQVVVENFYYTLMIILVFLIPMLTMRVVAEEKKRGTFELLVTSPLSISNIVIGKFLGVAFVVVVMMLLTFLFPALLFIYGNPEGPPIFSGLLGIILCALAFTSLGMAVSCFTENQIVAAVSGMVVLLLLYVIQAPAESVGGVAASILNYLSPMLEVRDMVKGVVTLKSTIYFLSVIAFGLFLSQRALEAYRWR